MTTCLSAASKLEFHSGIPLQLIELTPTLRAEIHCRALSFPFSPHLRSETLASTWKILSPESALLCSTNSAWYSLLANFTSSSVRWCPFFADPVKFTLFLRAETFAYDKSLTLEVRCRESDRQFSSLAQDNRSVSRTGNPFLRKAPAIGTCSRSCGNVRHFTSALGSPRHTMFTFQ